MPPSYLLATAFHKQAFASATQHQLLAFLQVAAFTNRTAVLPRARFGEPAYAGLGEAEGYAPLDHFFDVDALLKRWPCLRAVSFEQFQREKGAAPLVALQLGVPPGRQGEAFADQHCGRRSRPLMALKATFACASLDALASAAATLGSRWRDAAVVITNWSQKIVGLGDAASPLFGDAFAARGGCHDPRAHNDPRAFPPLAARWGEAADAFLAGGSLARPFYCAHVRAEKLASAATGREKRSQFIELDDGSWRSPYLERCARAAGAISIAAAAGRPLLLATDASEAWGTPSNQGSAHFREWRAAGERRLRAAFPEAAAYCGAPHAIRGPKCALAEVALCRRAAGVLRFGSGTFSAFLVGDADDRPPSRQFLDCPAIEAAAAALRTR